MKLVKVVPITLSAGQRQSMCGRSSIDVLNCSDSIQTPVLLLDQCLHMYSVLYLPETICAWMVAIATFEGEHPAVDHNG